MRLFVSALVLFLAMPADAVETSAHMIVRNSPLAGFRYNDGRLVWDEMRVDDRLTLIREPGNPFDVNAIRVEWNGRKIGYVPRQQNGPLARVLDTGAAIEGRIIELSKHRNGRHLISYDLLVPLQTAEQAHRESN
jgi:hypothetical protein